MGSSRVFIQGTKSPTAGGKIVYRRQSRWARLKTANIKETFLFLRKLYVVAISIAVAILVVYLPLIELFRAMLLDVKENEEMEEGDSESLVSGVHHLYEGNLRLPLRFGLLQLIFIPFVIVVHTSQLLVFETRKSLLVIPVVVALVGTEIRRALEFFFRLNRYESTIVSLVVSVFSIGLTARATDRHLYDLLPWLDVDPGLWVSLRRRAFRVEFIFAVLSLTILLFYMYFLPRLYIQFGALGRGLFRLLAHPLLVFVSIFMCRVLLIALPGTTFRRAFIPIVPGLAALTIYGRLLISTVGNSIWHTILLSAAVSCLEILMRITEGSQENKMRKALTQKYDDIQSEEVFEHSREKETPVSFPVPLTTPPHTPDLPKLPDHHVNEGGEVLESSGAVVLPSGKQAPRVSVTPPSQTGLSPSAPLPPTAPQTLRFSPAPTTGRGPGVSSMHPVVSGAPLTAITASNENMMFGLAAGDHSQWRARRTAHKASRKPPQIVYLHKSTKSQPQNVDERGISCEDENGSEVSGGKLDHRYRFGKGTMVNDPMVARVGSGWSFLEVHKSVFSTDQALAQHFGNSIVIWEIILEITGVIVAETIAYSLFHGHNPTLSGVLLALGSIAVQVGMEVFVDIFCIVWIQQIHQRSLENSWEMRGPWTLGIASFSAFGFMIYGMYSLVNRLVCFRPNPDDVASVILEFC